MRFDTFHLIGSPALAERRFGETLEQIALADESGFDYAWIAEHHFSGISSPSGSARLASMTPP